MFYNFIEQAVNNLNNNNTKLTNRDLQAIERRSQLLDSAKELFASNGYHATTTRQITKILAWLTGLFITISQMEKTNFRYNY